LENSGPRSAIVTKVKSVDRVGVSATITANVGNETVGALVGVAVVEACEGANVRVVGAPGSNGTVKTAFQAVGDTVTR
jgi:hypothetical protein